MKKYEFYYEYFLYQQFIFTINQFKALHNIQNQTKNN